MRVETYPKARERLFAEFKSLGFEVKDRLKVPQVKLVIGPETVTLFFKPQAVYLENHTLGIDIRSMSADTFLAIVTETKTRRNQF